ncbi:MAG: mechanosensitive ion channel family protein [Rubripirellula sp.]
MADAIPTTAPETATDAPGIAAATEDTIAKLTEGDYTAVMDYATTHLAPAMMYAAMGLGIIFLGYLIAKYISRVISRPVCRRVDETLGKFIGKMVFYTIMLGVTGAVLSKMGAPLGGLAAMLAAAGFAVGLAFQGTLSNFASGVLMLVFRPFKVGDVINAGGVSGKVNEIDLFTTTLDTPDNRRIIVPNSAISGGTIENISFHPHRRIEVVVGVDYTADIQETRNALETAAAVHAAGTIQGEGRGSQVILSNLGDSAVEWKVRMWVPAENYWPMLETVTGEVKQQLDAVNIGIPFPQLDVHLMREDGEEVRERPRVRPVRRDAA